MAKVFFKSLGNEISKGWCSSRKIMANVETMINNTCRRNSLTRLRRDEIDSK